MMFILYTIKKAVRISINLNWQKRQNNNINRSIAKTV